MTNVEAYLEWERNIEHVFDCNTFSDKKKMKLSIVEFTSHAENSYQHLKSKRRRKEEDSIEMWEELKDALRKSEAKGKFVVAKRMEAESSNSKKNEASKEEKEKSNSVQCWKCKGFGHMSKDCVNKKVMVIRNGIIDSKDECDEHDAPLEEESDAHDDEYIEGGSSIFLVKCNDMFPHEDAPTSLPPLRGIEHQIDFILGATLPNMAAYRINPTKAK
ncbi:Transposon Ty3-I Gag-Pol polyprotein [Cucumis melo var. makuwa]|uniref:Transposon Ty3-I Gag-Pol polyprotein n=1 Tax=Cucumis melo var. makuwa TaxID=1194695 RepID=A0A5A7SKE7_CUCMM|nr:Transposon Ty3-I Gag-Pol polyprotein [Cucumis melo var. makuwa]